MLDLADRLDTMRSHSTDWLEARRREVVVEVRRLQSEEHAILLVLDEQGRIDTSVGLDGESARTVREKVETARALESLPAIAAAAQSGALSVEQLGAVVKVADEESDAEWARRAPNITPADLEREARQQTKPTVAAIPNGPYAIVGNPNLPDGLRTVHIDELTPDGAEQVGLPRRRAGPNAP